jgi:hypothetical protein
VTRSRVARAITEASAPALLVVVQLLAIGAVSATRPAAGLAWAAVIAVFVGVIPYTIVEVGVHRGALTDRNITRREQRMRPLLASMGSVTLGLVIAVLGAPWQLVALVAAILASLVAVTTITRWWKVSAHSAVAAGTATVLMVVFGPVLLVAWPAVVAVAWSRVVLREHTVAQVIVGAPLGGAVAGVVFTALR